MAAECKHLSVSVRLESVHEIEGLRPNAQGISTLQHKDTCIFCRLAFWHLATTPEACRLANSVDVRVRW